MLNALIAALAGITAVIAGNTTSKHLSRDRPADGYFTMATGQGYTGNQITVGFWSGVCCKKPDVLMDLSVLTLFRSY